MYKKKLKDIFDVVILKQGFAYFNRDYDFSIEIGYELAKVRDELGQKMVVVRRRSIEIDKLKLTIIIATPVKVNPN